MLVSTFWYETFKKAGFGGQTPSPGRNLHDGLARGVGGSILLLRN